MSSVSIDCTVSLSVARMGDMLSSFSSLKPESALAVLKFLTSMQLLHNNEIGIEQSKVNLNLIDDLHSQLVKLKRLPC